MNSRFDNVFRIFFAFTDLFALCCINLFFFLYLDIDKETPGEHYFLLFMIKYLIWIISAYVSGVYINDRILNFKKFAVRTGRAVPLYCILLFLFIHFHHYPFNEEFSLLSNSFFFIYLIVIRFLFFYAFKYVEKQQRTKNKLIFLGHNEFSEKLTQQISKNNRTITILGAFDDNVQASTNSNLKTLGKIEDCIPYSIDKGITEIYSTLSPETYPNIYQIAQAAENLCIRFRFVPNLKTFVNRSIYLDYIDEIPILSLRSEPMEDFGVQVKKRMFDLTFSLLVSVFLLSWLIPIIAILIKLDSKGPIFFLQERSGKNNKSFKCIKFRSLKVNQESNIKQVTKGDNRITKLGKFLRKSNIDELPQFLNVLKGDMSVVGPRPHMLKHTEDYSKIIMKYMIRHYSKPGVTGWAQVNGFRGEIKEEEQLIKRIEHDVWYLENWSIWLDLKIIIRTVIVTIKGDENAF